MRNWCQGFLVSTVSELTMCSSWDQFLWHKNKAMDTVHMHDVVVHHASALNSSYVTYYQVNLSVGAKLDRYLGTVVSEITWQVTMGWSAVFNCVLQARGRDDHFKSWGGFAPRLRLWASIETMWRVSQSSQLCAAAWLAPQLIVLLCKLLVSLWASNSLSYPWCSLLLMIQWRTCEHDSCEAAVMYKWADSGEAMLISLHQNSTPQIHWSFEQFDWRRANMLSTLIELLHSSLCKLLVSLRVSTSLHPWLDMFTLDVDRLHFTSDPKTWNDKLRDSQWQTRWHHPWADPTARSVCGVAISTQQGHISCEESCDELVMN